MSDSGYPVHVLDPASSPREVYVVHPPRRRYWLHLLLFLATIFTTLVVGARLEYNYERSLPQFQSDADIFPLHALGDSARARNGTLRLCAAE